MCLKPTRVHQLTSFNSIVPQPHKYKLILNRLASLNHKKHNPIPNHILRRKFNLKPNLKLNPSLKFKLQSIKDILKLFLKHLKAKIFTTSHKFLPINM